VESSPPFSTPVSSSAIDTGLLRCRCHALCQESPPPFSFMDGSPPPPQPGFIYYSVPSRMWLLGMWLMLLGMWLFWMFRNRIELKPMKWYFTWLLFSWKWIQCDCLKMNTMWLHENEYNVITLKMNTMWFGFIYEFYYVLM
jgi:hypothetical protein